MKKALDLSTIKKNFKNSHKTFIGKVGTIPELVEANEALAVTKINAKLIAILQCLQDERIITNYEVKNGIFILTRNNSVNTILLANNGEGIVFRISNFFIDIGITMPQFKYFKMRADNSLPLDEAIDYFDWINFSNELLKFIHEHLFYFRQSIDLSF